MRTGTAFEFVGSMAGNFGYSEQSDTDAHWQLFNSGIGLLDAVGSVVSLWEMKKKTRLMEKVYSSKVFIDFIKKHEKSIEKEIESVEKAEYESMIIQINIKRSEAEELIIVAKNELTKQQEHYRIESLEHLEATKNLAFKVSNKEEETRELRYLFMDTISISQTAIDELRVNEVRNRLKIAELEDSIRKTISLLYRTFSDAI